MTLSEFADPSYRHCIVFCKLSAREALSIEKCLPSRLDVYPMWFYYSEEIQEQHLSVLLDSVLIECISRLSIPRGKTKKDRVHAVLCHFVATRSQVMRSSKDQLQTLLSRAPVTSEDSQLLVPRLARYFGDIYGKKVFEALCRPLSPQVCVFEPIDTPKICWSALPITDLVHRLRKLTIEVLSDCIRGLPSKGRPSITCRSRQKTCNGLAIHIRDRVNFLQCIGPSTVCDILLCY
jgi:hypothetical protein